MVVVGGSDTDVQQHNDNTEDNAEGQSGSSTLNAGALNEIPLIWFHNQLRFDPLFVN